MFSDDLKRLAIAIEGLLKCLKDHTLASQFDGVMSSNNQLPLMISQHDQSNLLGQYTAISQIVTNLSIAYPNGSRDSPKLCLSLAESAQALNVFTLALLTSSALVNRSLLSQLQSMLLSISRLCLSYSQHSNLKTTHEPTYLRDTGVIWKQTKELNANTFNARYILHARTTDTIALLNDAADELCAYIDSDEWHELIAEPFHSKFIADAKNLSKRVKLAAIVLTKLTMTLSQNEAPILESFDDAKATSETFDVVDTLMHKMQETVDDVVCEITCSEDADVQISTKSIDYFMLEITTRCLTLSTIESDHACKLCVTEEEDEQRQSISHSCSPIRTKEMRLLQYVYIIGVLFQDCKDVVAEKFFPLEIKESGRSEIFCEFDYFKRLDLICAKCNCALKGPHINALNKRYHLEHFSCTICPTVFKQNDQYYEKEGEVYCKTHYSIMFAMKCGGCKTSVLKNFVEMQRHGEVEQYHPDCYMVYKMKFGTSTSVTQPPETLTLQEAEDELERQEQVVEKVKQILTFVTAFEESAAESLSDMLINFSNANFQDGISQASKFICHIEILFTALDTIELALVKENDDQLFEHSKEPKQLARKIVHFFSLLSKSQTEARDESTKELISLVTQLARLLKSLIRFALLGALKLEQKYNHQDAIQNLITHLVSLGESKEGDIDEKIFLDLNASSKSEHCVSCSKSVETRCIKFGYNRWHLECFRCAMCKESLEENINTATFDDSVRKIFCGVHGGFAAKAGFSEVTQLSQYIFLLRCALGRLCGILSIKLDSETGTFESQIITERMKEITVLSDEDTVQHSSTQLNMVPPLEKGLSKQFFNASGHNISSSPDKRGIPLPGTSNQEFDLKKPSKRFVWLAHLDTFGFKFSGVIAVQKLQQILVPTYITREEFLMSLDTKNSSVLKKIGEAFKGEKKPKNSIEKTFGVPLEQLLSKYPSKIDIGVGPNPKTVPFVISESIKLMLNMDLRIEGIFRKNGNIKRLKTVSDALDLDPYSPEIQEDNQVQLAALIKKYLRDLPEPLIPYKLYKLLLAIVKITKDTLQKDALHFAMCLLPKANLELLYVIFNFLEYVASFSEDVLNPDGSIQLGGNKMDHSNMALVIAPNIFYAKNLNLTDEGADAFSGIGIVSLMMKYQDSLWKIPEAITSQLNRQDEAEESDFSVVYRQDSLRNMAVNKSEGNL